ncbi:hypothetical protein [Stenotrophomonas sp.]|uniref:hypothetical protein n=1 Tax=Stenotrophomonas sp. TaxID=69392 RepID=UPI0028B16166|nr:hypothetical protein [Stenotrophomonas sp.]
MKIQVQMRHVMLVLDRALFVVCGALTTVAAIAEWSDSYLNAMTFMNGMTASSTSARYS